MKIFDVQLAQHHREVRAHDREKMHANVVNDHVQYQFFSYCGGAHVVSSMVQLKKVANKKVKRG